jgi:hypothetical protein
MKGFTRVGLTTIAEGITSARRYVPAIAPDNCAITSKTTVSHIIRGSLLNLLRWIDPTKYADNEMAGLNTLPLTLTNSIATATKAIP